MGKGLGYVRFEIGMGVWWMRWGGRGGGIIKDRDKRYVVK